MKQRNPFLTLLALGVQESACVCWQMPEFRQRVDVLRRLGYVAADNTVQLKVCIHPQPATRENQLLHACCMSPLHCAHEPRLLTRSTPVCAQHSH